MTAAKQSSAAIAIPKAGAIPKDGGSSPKNHFVRRSSFQKIVHMCNQGYSAFPHVFIRLQDIHTTVSIDFKSLIPMFRSIFFSVAVSLALVTLLSQLIFCCIVACKYAAQKRPFFLFGCIIVLGILAWKCFSVHVVARVHRSLSCRRKDH